jgi:carboxyl-terminal processing protease
MKGKQYNYRSELEKRLAMFASEAKKERYYSDLKTQLDQITSRLAESRKNDLITFKDQIKLHLEEDIASRYYLEKGVVEVAFKYDQDVKKAIDVLNNTNLYKKTLNQ